MFSSIVDIFKIEELRKKILFTLGILAIFRLGAAIPLPGVNPQALRALFDAHRGGFLGFLDIFSGGAMSRLSILALGVMPYINASIIMSLLQGAHMIPYLDQLAKEGETGRKKISQLTRYLTVLIATIQAVGLTTMIIHMPVRGSELPVVSDTSFRFIFITVLTLVTGTIFVMWLGEQITELGIGNGISLLIFAGIIDRLPGSVKNFFQLLYAEEMNFLVAIVLLVIICATLVGVVWLETAQRRIPVQYAKRIIGRRMYGGASTFLPLRVDTAGVISVIFAVSIMTAPLTVLQFFPQSPWAQKISSFWTRGGILYEIIFAALIIFFCYFYNSIILNPQELAENLKKWGGFIQGIRPGEPTAKYIQYILERITLGGALAVVIIAVLPDLLRKWFNAPFYFGGTTILIAVGVALDTVGQIESQLLMRNYESLAKNIKIKGRWFNIR
ncbi:MAG: preprotein translocase subunit SecY [Endomicrobia bacterium]|nr:preprotein translocase subunit SecY [Endomicrobiia bacterium]MCX7941409.1 preprotein translocase subunit SecY [Endomicrobiia bacterium]MDW8055487.1 preprotein translocase subunit SecY [Elusimicrobiota bacterium]